MVIFTSIERETVEDFFKGKARAHSCPDLPLRDTATVALVDRYMLTCVERDGLLYRCLPYYQRRTHSATVKYVKKTWRVSLSISVRTAMIR